MEIDHKTREFMKSIVPEEYAEWLWSLPLLIEGDGYIITHAAINPSIPFEKCLNLGRNNMDPKMKDSIIWNRGGTRRREDNKFQIHGHTAHNNALALKDREGMYGMNVDSSRGGKLTAIHYPSLKLYEQEYLD